MKLKNKNGNYTFHKIDKKGKVTDKVKSEEELTEKDVELLYQGFAQHWDDLPLKAKNKFMKWLRQALEERHLKIIKNEIN